MQLITHLYEHQIRCVKKLIKIKIGALYLEMGTGKTRTALELIKIRLEKGKINHVLWLCPCSVKETLRRDIIKHTGSDCKGFITICGIETLSTSVKANSEMLKLSEIKDCYLIVDESNLVKNFQAKRTKNIIRLSENCRYKIILNGTPITKNETDLFAQWYILDWRVLGYKSYWSFAANHIEYDENISGKFRRVLNKKYLIEKISPYSYQIKKEECLDLPEKTYDIKYFYLTKEQDKHYDGISESMIDKLDDFEPTTVYRMFSALQNITSGYNVTIGENLKREKFFENFKENPRIQTLEYILESIGNHKVIIFCKYTDEIIDICNLLGDKALPYYGELNQQKRHNNIDEFEKDKQYFVANKTCAGYGLNLQFCNYIVYYNNDFNYGTRAQSEDRVHRMGQNKSVHIIDICANYTLDEQILKCLKKKEGMVETLKYQLEIQKDKKEYMRDFVRYRGKKIYNDDLAEEIT